MALLDHTINLTDLPEAENTGDFAALPAGDYDVAIAKCELKESKKGGDYFNFQFKVTGEKYRNRVVFGMITRKNSNETAERIGAEQLRKIMSACGIGSLTDTDQFIGCELVITLGQREYQGVMQNEVKNYKCAGTSFAPAPTTEAKPATTGKAAPPWAKK